MSAAVSYVTRKEATPELVSRLVDLIRMMHAETGFANTIFSESKVISRINECLDTGVVVIALEDGEIVGSLGLYITEFWYAEDRFIAEGWTFIHPDHRRSQHIQNLLELTKLAGDTAGLPVIVAVFSNIRTKGKSRLFGRHLESYGEFFVHAPREKVNVLF